MTFVPDGVQIPRGLNGRDFVLEPLTVDHLALDYAAVMSGREMLRVWSGTDWPADDFTLEENLVDLERHEREHRAGEAFTFTVLAPDRARCIGCVYLTPLANLIEANLTTLEDAPAGAAVLGFWVVPDEVDRLGSLLLARLVDWMRSDWRFPAVYFATPQVYREQAALLAAGGLVPRFEVAVPEREGAFLLHEPG